jgi:pimeloyl-[acyl-carrier protein] synthase
MTTLAQTPIDLREGAFVTNPYPFYARLREEKAVYWASREDTAGLWLVTRYADVEKVLKDSSFKKDARPLLKKKGGPAPVLPPMMLMVDPPDHARLRNLVNRAFTPAVSRGLAPRIRSIVDELLERVKTKGELEFVQDFAIPLPVMVIAELLGVPLEDRERFRAWSGDFAAGSDFIAASAETLERGRVAIFALKDYFAWLIHERRAEPKADLISELINAHDEAGKLSEEELLGSCILLLVAGHETTMNLLGNGLHALLTFPEQMAKLREGPGLMESAVEEMLRYDAPLQRSTYRYAAEKTVIAGQTIEYGQSVSAVIGSANRDPDVFCNPESFDITRHPNRHQSFGRGIHFCLGAPLARLEAQIAFKTLLETFPKLDFSSDASVWRPNSIFRGLERFPVSFE